MRGFFLAVGNEAIKFNLGVVKEKKDEYRGWIEQNEREREKGKGEKDEESEERKRQSEPAQ